MQKNDLKHDAMAKDELSALQSEANRLDLPFIRDAADVELAADLLIALPVEWTRAHTALPVQYGGRPVLMVSHPRDLALQAYVSLVTGNSVETALAPADLVKQCIEKAYALREDSPQSFIDALPAESGGGDARVANDADDLLVSSHEAPVSQLINLILLDAIRQRASDVHFEPFARRLRVRFRIDGVLYEQSSPPDHVRSALVSRLKVMAHLDIAEKRLPQDGMAKVRVGNREVDIRISTVPVHEGERVVLRLLDQGNTLLSLSTLGMDAVTQDKLAGLLAVPNGMVVVCGPTGSGKTTTLYAALSGLDSSRQNIMTVEDPIEYQLEDVGQIQVKPKIGITFASGLRHILRQDPDVILVGETRDEETAEIAVRAALTGHLVFTTLHTNDAPGAVIRLIDIGVAPYLISACLRGCLGQRLVRCLCPECRERYEVDDAVAESWVEALRGQSVWRAKGCEACTQGYHGRSGLYELMTVTESMSEAIRRSDCHLSIVREHALAGGMLPLIEDGIQKIRKGITTIDEVRRAAAI